MQTTIGEFISRIRNEIKAVKQDAFLSDRFLYSLSIKHAAWLLKREDGANKLLKQQNIIQTLDFVELIETDKVDAGCRGIYSGCTIKKTRFPIPEMFNGYSGALIRAVTSLDGSEELQQTSWTIYLNISNQSTFKYNRTKYYWFQNQHLFFPDLEWDAVRMEGIFKGDVSSYGCDECKICRLRQDQPFNIPAYLFGELESYILKDLSFLMGIPSDNNQDKQSITR